MMTKMWFLISFNNRNVIAPIVGYLLAPLEPVVSLRRRNPVRNPNYVEKTIPLYTVWILAKPEAFLACSDRFGIAQSTGHYIYREIINILSNMVADIIVWPTFR